MSKEIHKAIPKWMERTQLLVGEEGIRSLMEAHVLVVGLGGVGSFAAEFLARAGVGSLTIVDGDVVDTTNRNRQLPALHSTIGYSKALWMEQRLKDINPDIDIHTVQSFVTPDMVTELLSTKFDYVIDAIDSITPKITFLGEAKKHRYPIVSSMGAGGKLDPTQIKVADIGQTYNCPFAQYIRKQLKRKYAISKGIKTVFSPEEPVKESLMLTDGTNFKRSAYGTISYLPAAFGGVLSSVVIRELIGQKVKTQKLRQGARILK